MVLALPTFQLVCTPKVTPGTRVVKREERVRVHSVERGVPVQGNGGEVHDAVVGVIVENIARSAPSPTVPPLAWRMNVDPPFMVRFAVGRL